MTWSVIASVDIWVAIREGEMCQGLPEGVREAPESGSHHKERPAVWFKDLYHYEFKKLKEGWWKEKGNKKKSLIRG